MCAGIETVKPDEMATHSQNRYGMGLDPVGVHVLLNLICKEGWSFQEVRGACAFELGPPGTSVFFS